MESDAQPREPTTEAEFAAIVHRPVKINPRTGMPYPERTQEEWRLWREQREASKRVVAPPPIEEPPAAKKPTEPESETKVVKPMEPWLRAPSRPGFSVEEIQRAGTLQEAILNNACIPGDVGGIRAIWEMRPEPTLEYTLEDPYTWQRQLRTELAQPRLKTDRKLRWIYNPEGNVGMSTFCRWMTLSQRDSVVTLQQGGRIMDVAHVLTSHKAQYNKDPKVVLIDLGRAGMKRAIYETLEAILNGAMFSAKYESRSVFFEKPHVVCFANWPPNTTSQALSEDRWDIRKIKVNARAKGYAVMETVTLEQARCQRAALLDAATEEQAEE